MGRLLQTLSVLAVIGAGVGPAVAAASGEKAQKDVLAALDTLKQGTMKKDRAMLEKVLHPDLSYGHSNGNLETKAQAIEHIVDNPVTYDAIEFGDTKVRVHGNTALVTGKVDMQQRVDENRAEIHLMVLTVWLKSAKGWQLVARQATRPPPPGQPAPPAPAKP